MKSETKTQHEQNNSKLVDLQKIREYNSLRKIGAWQKHFKALRRFGIYVDRLMIDNELLKRQKVILKNELVELRKAVLNLGHPGACVQVWPVGVLDMSMEPGGNQVKIKKLQNIVKTHKYGKQN